MMRFTYNNLNNGVLSTNNSMPLKDSTSDNNASFQIARRSYVDTEPNTSRMKWYGNRDSSDVARRRRVFAVGKGTFNDLGKPTAFTSEQKNIVNTALRRSRAGGHIVPAKATQSTSQMF